MNVTSFDIIGSMVAFIIGWYSPEIRGYIKMKLFNPADSGCGRFE